jgi:phage N-6-adenine-methyltransferase
LAKLPRAVFANGARSTKDPFEKLLRDGYRTPQSIVDEIENRDGPITLDVAASAENRVRPVPFFSAQDDALQHQWNHPVQHSSWWANPPFSLTDEFITKGIAEVFTPTEGPTRRGTFLVNACTETKWWHELMGSLSSVTGSRVETVARFSKLVGPLAGYIDIATLEKGGRLRTLTVNYLKRRVNFANPELFKYLCEKAAREGTEPPKSDTGPAPKGSIVAVLENRVQR